MVPNSKSFNNRIADNITNIIPTARCGISNYIFFIENAHDVLFKIKLFIPMYFLIYAATSFDFRCFFCCYTLAKII